MIMARSAAPASMLFVMICLFAAVVPAVVLMGYIFHKDQIEREPVGLLLRLSGGGILAALASIVLETIAFRVIGTAFSPASRAYLLVSSFVGIAAVEEGSKFFFLRNFSWNHPAFDFRFDGIVYSAFTSLGFAAFENIQYVFNYGLSVALPRAVISIPGHFSFAVLMGVFYGHAKKWSGRGDVPATRFNLIVGIFLAVLAHGFFDSCALSGTAFSMTVFLMFNVLMDLTVWKLIRIEAAFDHRV